VDESPEGVGGDHAQEPKDAQHDENCPKHCYSNLTRNPYLQGLCRNRSVFW
jgi:hypothetical protein